MKNRGKLAFQFHAISKGSPFKIPLMSSTVTAGFPSPADDHLDLPIDLNEYLVKHPAATFYVRVQGDSMDDAGIHQGDLLIVDRAEPYTMGSIVLAVLDGEFTVKKLMEKTILFIFYQVIHLIILLKLKLRLTLKCGVSLLILFTVHFSYVCFSRLQQLLCIM